MNKSDLRLVLIIVLIAVSILFVFSLKKQEGTKKALVYYGDDLILTIDLSLNEEKTYLVDGYNGKVTIKTKEGKIKVDEEKSPLHLCSKQGYIKEAYEMIVCLPNKIIIRIENTSDIDAVVR